MLQQGVTLSVEVGGSVRELLCAQLGIPGDYIKERISTLFLNGRAIDDFDKALVRESAVVSLSGAMPGLVGATMRSGGHLAALREAITYHEDSGGEGRCAGSIRLKLFNLILPELAPLILHWGIRFSAQEMRSLVKKEAFASAVERVVVDGQGELGLEELQCVVLPAGEEPVKLSVSLVGECL